MFASVLLDFLIFGEITAAELGGCLKNPVKHPEGDVLRGSITLNG